MSVVKSVSLINARLLAESFNNSSNTGMTQGKPKIAVSIWLLPDLAPMAAINVNIEENPTLARKSVNANNGRKKNQCHFKFHFAHKYNKYCVIQLHIYTQIWWLCMTQSYKQQLKFTIYEFRKTKLCFSFCRCSFRYA